MRFAIFMVTLLIPGALTMAGCGSGHPLLGKVTGTVAHRGAPLSAGSIVFEVTGARPARGRIADGQIIEVTTYELDDGVPIGNARIAVFATDASAVASAVVKSPSEATVFGSDYMGMGAKSLIPLKYNDPAASGISFDIKQGANVVTLDLKDN